MKKLLAIILSVCAIAAALSFTGCKKKSVTLSEYDIFASYDTESRTLTGTVDFTFYNNTDNEIDILKFNLFGNAFREGAAIKPVSSAYSGKAYYGGASYGGMEITEVQNCLNWNVGGEDENILNVTLTSPVYPEHT
ncbi:MAG: hypothetical protein K2N33_04560, partial [Clostridia bacterium]|nr:hypothetical protein [Clostridia bacterium]